jgi:hypothetical protein
MVKLDRDSLDLIVRLGRIVLKDDTISLNNISNVNMLKEKYDTDISDDDYYETDVFVYYAPYDDDICSVSVNDLISEMIDMIDGEW